MNLLVPRRGQTARPQKQRRQSDVTRRPTPTNKQTSARKFHPGKQTLPDFMPERTYAPTQPNPKPNPTQPVKAHVTRPNPNQTHLHRQNQPQPLPWQSHPPSPIARVWIGTLRSVKVARLIASPARRMKAKQTQVISPNRRNPSPASKRCSAVTSGAGWYKSSSLVLMPPLVAKVLAAED